MKVTAFSPENRGVAPEEGGPDSEAQNADGNRVLIEESSDQESDREHKEEFRDNGRPAEAPKAKTPTFHKQEVDLAVYKRANDSNGEPASEFDIPGGERDCSKIPEPIQRCLRYAAHTSWNHIIVPIEVKTRHRPCTFELPDARLDGSIENGHDEGAIARSRMMEYIGKILLHQQRIFLFSIYMHGQNVYLIRWDRDGAVVSEPFDLLENPERLHLFLFRLEKMTPAQQGFDDTVKPATEEEIKRFREFKPTADYHKVCQQEALDPGWLRYSIDLPGWEDMPGRRLVFGKPHFGGRRVVGRGTRGYVAFDLLCGRLVFLKDCWRRLSGRPELDVYARLKKAGVRCIATPIGGGDVDIKTQMSVSREYSRRNIASKTFDPRVHYRFAVTQVGRPLEDHSSADEMVGAISCGLLGTRLGTSRSSLFF